MICGNTRLWERNFLIIFIQQMQATGKFTRKVITQIITVYQWVLNVTLKDIWIEIMIKPNKDVDDMLDVINNELINVCWEYLKEHKLSLDKYQLATICAQLVTLAIDNCDEPFRISVKWTKALVQEYLEKNKSKREALERIKNENDELDKEIAVRKQEIKKKNVDLVAEPEMPREISDAGPMGSNPPVQPQKKIKRKWTDALAIDDFRLPI